MMNKNLSIHRIRQAIKKAQQDSYYLGAFKSLEELKEKYPEKNDGHSGTKTLNENSWAIVDDATSPPEPYKYTAKGKWKKMSSGGGGKLDPWQEDILTQLKPLLDKNILYFRKGAETAPVRGDRRDTGHGEGRNGDEVYDGEKWIKKIEVGSIGTDMITLREGLNDIKIKETGRTFNIARKLKTIDGIQIGSSFSPMALSTDSDRSAKLFYPSGNNLAEVLQTVKDTPTKLPAFIAFKWTKPNCIVKSFRFATSNNTSRCRLRAYWTEEEIPNNPTLGQIKPMIQDESLVYESMPDTEFWNPENTENYGGALIPEGDVEWIALRNELYLTEGISYIFMFESFDSIPNGFLGNGNRIYLEMGYIAEGSSTIISEDLLEERLRNDITLDRGMWLQTLGEPNKPNENPQARNMCGVYGNTMTFGDVAEPTLIVSSIDLEFQKGLTGVKEYLPTKGWVWSHAVKHIASPNELKRGETGVMFETSPPTYASCFEDTESATKFPRYKTQAYLKEFKCCFIPRINENKRAYILTHGGGTALGLRYATNDNGQRFVEIDLLMYTADGTAKRLIFRTDQTVAPNGGICADPYIPEANVENESYKAWKIWWRISGRNGQLIVTDPNGGRWTSVVLDVAYLSNRADYYVGSDRHTPNSNVMRLWDVKLFATQNVDGTGESTLVDEKVFETKNLRMYANIDGSSKEIVPHVDGAGGVPKLVYSNGHATTGSQVVLKPSELGLTDKDFVWISGGSSGQAVPVKVKADLTKYSASYYYDFTSDELVYYLEAQGTTPRTVSIWKFESAVLPAQKGDKGDKGDTGETGATGTKGEIGETGAKGDKGEQGVQGIQGARGDKGEKGDNGSPWDKKIDLLKNENIYVNAETTSNTTVREQIRNNQFTYRLPSSMISPVPEGDYIINIGNGNVSVGSWFDITIPNPIGHTKPCTIVLGIKGALEPSLNISENNFNVMGENYSSVNTNTLIESASGMRKRVSITCNPNSTNSYVIRMNGAFNITNASMDISIEYESTVGWIDLFKNNKINPVMLPSPITPSLSQVLTSGNTASTDINMNRQKLLNTAGVHVKSTNGTKGVIVKLADDGGLNVDFEDGKCCLAVSAKGEIYTQKVHIYTSGNGDHALTDDGLYRRMIENPESELGNDVRYIPFVKANDLLYVNNGIMINGYDKQNKYWLAPDNSTKKFQLRTNGDTPKDFAFADWTLTKGLIADKVRYHSFETNPADLHSSLSANASSALDISYYITDLTFLHYVATNNSNFPYPKCKVYAYSDDTYNKHFMVYGMDDNRGKIVYGCVKATGWATGNEFLGWKEIKTEDVGTLKTKVKKVTGIAPNAQGNSVLINHGLSYNKIISVTCLIDDQYSRKIPPSYTTGSGSQYCFMITANAINIELTTTNSINLLGKPVTIYITYEE